MKLSLMDIGTFARGRNGRASSEDRLSVCETFVGVYDGHGGSEVSDYVSKHLPKRFDECGGDFLQAFTKVDTEVAEVDKVMYRMSGTTATCAHIDPERGCIRVAHVGDSRAILVPMDTSQPLQVLTVDDNCRTNPEEVHRIQQCGGRVVDCRVERILAVTRAIGDGDFRTSGVICEPHVTLPTEVVSPSVLVLATDGLWDVLSNEQVATYLRSQPDFVSAKVLAKELVRQAVARRTMDDVTVIIVKFTKK
jgi:serine/threonine protein phosphatase PrpC